MAQKSNRKVELKRDGTPTAASTDKIVFLRLKPELYKQLEDFHIAHCKKNELNPYSYGISTMIRDILIHDVRRKNAKKQRALSEKRKK